jgi:hypothetical protein
VFFPIWLLLLQIKYVNILLIPVNIKRRQKIMEFITTLIHQIVELFAKLQTGGQEAAELFQAFLKFVGDILRFLEEHGLSKQIVDAIFQLILKIFGAA